MVFAMRRLGVKELMKMMGLPNWLHWVGWFFITILISIITISVMVIIVIAGEILEKVDSVILFISLFLYGFSIICFNFAISTFFSNRKSIIIVIIHTNDLMIVQLTSLLLLEFLFT